MVWKKVRIDFTDRIKCQFCPQPITSGKGIVVVNEDGEYAFSGPCCAKKAKNVINPTEKLIDVTKGCLEYSVTSSPSRILSNSDNNPLIVLESNDYFDENAVKAYLLLRFEKLTHIPAINTVTSSKLTEIYNQYKKTDKISEKDKKYLEKVMYGENFPKFTYKNLQAVYAADFWLNLFIQHNKAEDLKFIESLLKL